MDRFIEDGRMIWDNYRAQCYTFIGVGLFVGFLVGLIF